MEEMEQPRRRWSSQEEMERPRRRWSGPGGDGAAQEGENDLRSWWGSVEYITSRKRTVRLGSLLGLYERFPIKK